MPVRGELPLRKVEVRRGVTLEYYDSGRGKRPVVLLPGFAATHRTYRRLIPKLEAQGHRVLAPNFAGHGRSTSRFRPHIRTYVQDLHALLAKVGVDSGEAVLVGLCLGGQIAHAYAREHRVRKTVLLSPQLFGTRNARRLPDLLRMVAHNLRGALRMTLNQLLEGGENVNRATLRGLASDYLAHRTTGYGRTRANSHTLILASTRDEGIPAWEFGRVHELIPNSRLEWLEARHFLPAYPRLPEVLIRELA